MKSGDRLKRLTTRLRGKIVQKVRHYPFYHALYPSFWHLVLQRRPAAPSPATLFLSAQPHPGAGIGHQIANWIAGLEFARQFGLAHAHIPFSSQSWERFLGFGDQQVTLEQLVMAGHRLVRLPFFDEQDESQTTRIQKIIDSYQGQNVVFLLEQDQFLRDQYLVAPELQSRFYAAAARNGEEISFERGLVNIGLHIRRGDIVTSPSTGSDNLKMRWQDDLYFERALQHVIEGLNGRPYAVFLFSQGEPQQFANFTDDKALRLCLDMGPRESFLHMCKADILITSKSSFSYKPALLNQGIKICPGGFWHGYPDLPEWIVANDDGTFDIDRLRSVVSRSLPAR